MKFESRGKSSTPNTLAFFLGHYLDIKFWICLMDDKTKFFTRQGAGVSFTVPFHVCSFSNLVPAAITVSALKWKISSSRKHRRPNTVWLKIPLNFNNSFECVPQGLVLHFKSCIQYMLIFQYITLWFFFSAVRGLDRTLKPSETAMFALKKTSSKPPVRKSASLTLMNDKYSASVRIMCRDWRANGFLPCLALKLGKLFTLFWCCFSSHICNTSFSFSIPIDSTCNVNGSAFQMDPLGCSISTYCTNPYGLTAGSLLLLCRYPCLRGQKPTCMLISQDCV